MDGECDNGIGGVRGGVPAGSGGALDDALLESTCERDEAEEEACFFFLSLFPMGKDTGSLWEGRVEGWGEVGDLV